MSQRDVRPQEQSLCGTVQAWQLQYSHQIHLRWFTSSTNRATIQRRIWVCDTLTNVSARRRRGQWAARPNVGSPRSYDGRERPSEEPLPPDASRRLVDAAAASDAAREEADQPDQRHDGGDDEEPVDDEARAERDDRQNRKHYQKQHVLSRLLG